MCINTTLMCVVVQCRSSKLCSERPVHSSDSFDVRTLHKGKGPPLLQMETGKPDSLRAMCRHRRSLKLYCDLDRSILELILVAS